MNASAEQITELQNLIVTLMRTIQSLESQQQQLAQGVKELEDKVTRTHDCVSMGIKHMIRETEDVLRRVEYAAGSASRSVEAHWVALCTYARQEQDVANAYPEAPNPYPDAPNPYPPAPIPYTEVHHPYPGVTNPYPETHNPYTGPPGPFPGAPPEHW